MTIINPLLRDRAAMNNLQFTYSDYANIEAITATADGLTTAIITANMKVVQVSSANVAYYVDLPYTSTVGHVMRVITGAIGAKMTSVQNTVACTINGVSVRNKAAVYELRANTVTDFIKSASTAWIAIPADSDINSIQGVPVANATIHTAVITAAAAAAADNKIPAGVTFVAGDSTNDAHFIALPPSVAGTKIVVMNIDSAQDFILVPLTAGAKINGLAAGDHAGGGVGFLVGEGDMADCYCISATQWIIIRYPLATVRLA